MVFPAPGGPTRRTLWRAGRRDLEGPLDVLLALDVLEVHGIDGRGDELALVEAAGRDVARLPQEPDDPDEVLEGVDLEVADERGLPGVGRGDDERRGSRLSRAIRAMGRAPRTGLRRPSRASSPTKR